MRVPGAAALVTLCVAFSIHAHADEFISLVEENFPYQEVNESFGAAKIAEGRCKEGTPFTITEEDAESDTNMDIAERIHARIRSLGANAFVITDRKEDTRVRQIMVTPLTCELR